MSLYNLPKDLSKDLPKDLSKDLPKEIINLILEYSGKIKYKDGKYINQLNIDDMYNGVKQIIQKKINNVKRVIVCDSDDDDEDDVDNHTFFVNIRFLQINCGLYYI
jgi:hypothetical protein